MFERLIEKYKPAPIKVKFFDSKNRVVSAISKSKSFEVFLGRKKIIQRSYYPEELNTWQKHDLVGAILFEIELEVYNKWISFVEKESKKFLVDLRKNISEEKTDKKIVKKFKELITTKGIKYKKPYFIKKVKTESNKYKKEYTGYEVIMPKYIPQDRSGEVLSVKVDFINDNKIYLDDSNYNLVWKDFALQAIPHVQDFLKKAPKKGRLSAYFIVFADPIKKEFIGRKGLKRHSAISFASTKLDANSDGSEYFETIVNDGMFHDNFKKYISLGQTPGYVIKGFEARITYNTKNRDETLAKRVALESERAKKEVFKSEGAEIYHNTKMKYDPKYRKKYYEKLKKAKQKIALTNKAIKDLKKKNKKKKKSKNSGLLVKRLK